MKIPRKLPYISNSQQEMIIEAFIKFCYRGYEITLDFLHKTGLSLEFEAKNRNNKQREVKFADSKKAWGLFLIRMKILKLLT